MDPGQHDVRRHLADGDCLVLDIGNVAVGWPVVRHQPGVGGHGAEHESVDLVLAEALDYLQPGASRRAAVDFDRPCDQHLADPTAPAGTTIGSFLVRNGMVVSSASTTPLSGSRSGLTIARRSLPHNIQAVRYEPRPSWLCSCSAEMPLECVAMRNAAQNQIVSGSLLACMIVPAVPEVCRPQPAHS